MAQRVFRVTVVDDHQMFAEALAALLDNEPDLTAEAGARVDASVAETSAAPDVDVLLLAGSAVHLVAETLASDPTARVIVVGEREDPVLLAAAIRDGAMGFLTKGTPPSESLATVRAVARGELRIPSGLMSNAMYAARDGAVGARDADVTGLTLRQAAVLRCLADGMTRTEAAAALGVSVNTVRTHIQNILSRLGVRSSLAAVAKARRIGLVT